MSTRATYKINDETFYIHHDGYPAGGAAYLSRMLKLDPIADDLALAFGLSNDRAEYTAGHHAHGDTEYRYSVTKYPRSIHLVVYARDMQFYPADSWELHFSGPLNDFIAKHQESPLFENLSTVGATKSEVPA